MWKNKSKSKLDLLQNFGDCYLFRNTEAKTGVEVLSVYQVAQTHGHIEKKRRHRVSVRFQSARRTVAEKLPLQSVGTTVVPASTPGRQILLWLREQATATETGAALFKSPISLTDELRSKMSTGKRLAKRSILGTRVAVPGEDGRLYPGIIQVRQSPVGAWRQVASRLIEGCCCITTFFGRAFSIFLSLLPLFMFFLLFYLGPSLFTLFLSISLLSLYPTPTTFLIFLPSHYLTLV